MMKKFLIIKTSALGDLVQVYPVLDYLKNKFPDAQIDWVVESANEELVRAHPKVNKTISIPLKQLRKHPFSSETWVKLLRARRELRKEVYDAAFDLQGNTKSGLILSQVRSPNKIGFDSTSVPEWPNLLFTNHRSPTIAEDNIRQNYVSMVSSFFGETATAANGIVRLTLTDEQRKLLHALKERILTESKPIVMICPGSAWKNKQLSYETLAAFLNLLEKPLKCSFLLVWGSKEEQTTCQQLHAGLPNCSHVIDSISIPMLQNLMYQCDLVIAMDSLALHLAATTNIPTFSVFGASLATKYKPIGNQHHTFQGNCPYGRSFNKRCPILRSCSTGACIRNLPPKALFDDFIAWWQGQKANY